MADTFSHGDTDYLTDTQLGQLLKGINPVRVNRDPKGMSYVEAYEIRAHLTRIFGPLRWDEQITDQRMVFESGFEDGGKDKYGQPTFRWTACWYAHCTLTIRSTSGTTLAVYGEGATGDATNLPSRADAHDMAVKTAASQALKRCAMNLGDQFGLSLYQKGSTRPLVQRTLIWDPTEQGSTAEPDAHITTPLAPEGAPEQGGESQRETTSPPASKAPQASGVVTEVPAANGVAPAETALSAAPAVEPERTNAEKYAEYEAEGMVMHGSIDLGLSEADANAMEQAVNEEFEADLAAAMAGPTAPDADGDSPAVSGESASSPAEAVDPTPASEETAPASAATPSTPAVPSAPVEPSSEPSASTGPAPVSQETAEDGGEDPIDAWERIVATLAVIRMSPPEEGLQILNGLMETAAQHRLATRRYPDTDKALSVVLTETMRDARAAIERRKAAAAGAS